MPDLRDRDADCDHQQPDEYSPSGDFEERIDHQTPAGDSDFFVDFFHGRTRLKKEGLMISKAETRTDAIPLYHLKCVQFQIDKAICRSGPLIPTGRLVIVQVHFRFI